ncbi:MAG: protein kinase [Rhodothermales bacterium]
MSDLNWQLVKSIFHEALLHPVEERAAFLELNCDEEQVRKEVLSLLSFYEEDKDFLESSVDTGVFRVIEEASQEQWQGQVIGHYRLEKELGRGGMGVVYLADRIDGQFDHRVAIKLGKQDEFNTEIRERLKHERQVLATLQHPNIAQLLDGGVTDTGRPFFAMEYVEGGTAIDVFCSTRSLSLKKRLRLFQKVCEAVAYAHRQLVVHRDLKPSNILVTPNGTVKLLDFGVSKLLDETRVAVPITRTGLRMLTPEYASPEQIRGGNISTASDVYSLGVILYELLVGRRPYNVRDISPTQAEHLICEVDPAKPSTAILESNEGKDQPATKIHRTARSKYHRQLKGDLDNIVLKALRKEPARRYGSVEQLNEDIGRYLDLLPIAARPSTVRYRVGKFVNRHRVGVAAACVILLALLGGIISTTYQARQALLAREKAEQRMQDVRAMANTLLFDFHDAIRDLPGATPARRLLVKNAQQYLDILAEELPDDPLLQTELAEAYHRVGEIQGDPHYPNLGDLGGAAAFYKKALHLRTSLWEKDPGDPLARHALAIAKSRQAVVSSWGGANEEAISLSKEAIALLESLYEEDRGIAIKHDLGRIRSELGWWYVFAGQVEEAKRHLLKAREELESISAGKSGDINFEIDLWRVYNYQVDAYRWGDDPLYALNILESTACPRLERLDAQLAFNPRLKSVLRTCLNKIGDLSKHFDQYEKAIGYFEEALDIAWEMAASDSTNILGRQGVATLLEALGAVHKDMGNTTEALDYFERARSLKQELYDIDPSNGEMGNMLGNTLRSLCVFYAEIGQHQKATALCKESVLILDKAISVDPLNGIWQSNLVDSYLALADAHQVRSAIVSTRNLEQQSLRESMVYYDKGIALIQLLIAEDRAFKWSAKLDSLQAMRELIKQNLTKNSALQQ